MSKYLSVQEMLNMIDEPNRTACLNLHKENLDLFMEAIGSTHNHQAWHGGYHDHIQEAMNVCVLLYPVYSIRPLNFTLSDALLVTFLHDLEKPWRDQVAHRIENAVAVDTYPTLPWIIKRVRREFRNETIQKYGIALTYEQKNALRYVEGEGDDYSGQERAMNELAAFCHIADVTSARIWHDYPKMRNAW